MRGLVFSLLRRAFFCLLIGLIWATAVRGQDIALSQRNRPVHLTSNHGQNILSIDNHQDRDGGLWFFTYEGLVRFKRRFEANRSPGQDKRVNGAYLNVKSAARSLISDRENGQIRFDRDISNRQQIYARGGFVIPIFCGGSGNSILRAIKSGFDTYYSHLLQTNDRPPCSTTWPAIVSYTFFTLLIGWGFWMFIRVMKQNREAQNQLRRYAIELEKARDEAESAARAKGIFLANMSHEIRTPINSVVGFTHLLLDTELTKEQRDFAISISSSGETLLEIVNDILDFSKIEAGKIEPEELPVKISEIIEDSIELIAPLASKKGLDIAHYESSNVPDTVIGDATRIRQVLTNLLSNAVKFTEKGLISVIVELSDTSEDADPEILHVHFSVQDTGMGIPADKLDLLFNAYTQAESSTARKFGGSGLGLVISKRLCELMGGRVWVTSKVGEGSCFHFTIKTRVPADSGLPEGKCEKRKLVSKHHILIVDENEAYSDILIRQLKKWGIAGMQCATGKEALAKLRSRSAFDAALVSNNLPDMTGAELADMIACQSEEIIPVILLAPLGQRVDSWQGPLITKPIKNQFLLKEITNVLKNQKTMQPVKGTSYARISLGEKHPLKILVADDNDINQKVILKMLERLGYHADVVSNGFEVLEAVTRCQYDVILLDIQMPGLDGIETARLLSERDFEVRPKLIALTANALTGDREQCLEAGMDDYLTKPVRVQDLASVLSTCPIRNTSSHMETMHLEDLEVSSNAISDVGNTYQGIMQVISLEWVYATAGGDEQFVKELAQRFLIDSRVVVEELQRAFSARDSKRLYDLAHSLKSSSQIFGAFQLAELCARVENASERNDIDGISSTIRKIRRNFEQVCRSLEDHFAESA